MSVEIKLPYHLRYLYKGVCNGEFPIKFNGNSVLEIIEQLPKEIFEKIINNPKICRFYINEDNYEKYSNNIVNLNSKVVDGDVIEIPVHIGGKGCCG